MVKQEAVMRRWLQVPPVTPKQLVWGNRVLSILFAMLLVFDYFFEMSAWLTALHAFLLGASIVGIANGRLLVSMEQQLDLLRDQQEHLRMLHAVVSSDIAEQIATELHKLRGEPDERRLH